MKKLASLVLASVFGAVLALSGYFLITKTKDTSQSENDALPTFRQVSYTPSSVSTRAISTDFTVAAEKTVNAVVHVKNTAIRTGYGSPMDYFFGNGGSRKSEQIGTGSGVIVTPDGYIVTNNHVIDGAREIEITLNNHKRLKAELVGTDPKNDIALLKVNADVDLPYIPFGNSDNVKVGEWVLAVGNPYNLTSTVTAGIVSAKGRDLKGNNNIESFIQTDAAVNPGNSGGALVNTRGELLGINTAISSRTGSFVGYSFAVPSNIAKKIVDDLLEFGDVQEALIGISFAQDDDQIEGVKISDVTEDGGAEKAGLKSGDVITRVNNVKISEFSDLRGQLSAKRPGEKVAVTVNRDGKEIVKNVILGKKDFVDLRMLGLRLKDVSKSDKKKFKLNGGAKIIANGNRNLAYYGVKEGYIISKINKQEVKNAQDAKRLLTASTRSNEPLYLEVVNLNGERERYAFRQ